MIEYEQILRGCRNDSLITHTTQKLQESIVCDVAVQCEGDLVGIRVREVG